MSCYCNYLPADFIVTRRHTARKQHECCECGRPITPGEEYRTDSGKGDGEFFHYATCEQCEDLFESLRELDYCIGIGNLYDAYAMYLEDHDVSNAGSRAREVQLRWKQGPCVKLEEDQPLNIVGT